MPNTVAGDSETVAPSAETHSGRRRSSKSKKLLPTKKTASPSWTNAGPADPENGHAMLITGRNAGGGYDVQTWGFRPPINLTPAGLAASDPVLATWTARLDDWLKARGVLKK